jgi:hypothetical protein
MGNKVQTLSLNEDEKRIKILSILLINKIYVLEKLRYYIYISSKEIDVNKHMNLKMNELKSDLDALLCKLGSFQSSSSV